MPLLLVMLGGAVGSALRYLSGRAAFQLFGGVLPWGTLFVNLAGGLAMGSLVGLLLRFATAQAEPWRLLLGVGVLGGFTTFSSFTLETVAMIERGQAGLALGYIGVSVAGSIALMFAGLALMRALPA